MKCKFIVKNSEGKQDFVYMVKNGKDYLDRDSVVYEDDIIRIHKHTWYTGNITYYFDHIDTSKDIDTIISDEIYETVSKSTYTENDDGRIPVYLISLSATEIWNKYVSIRGYKEPDGNLEDDAFFNDGRICKKYDDWDSENLCRKYAKTNTELRELLDAEDTKKYAEYMEMYMEYAKDDISWKDII